MPRPIYTLGNISRCLVNPRADLAAKKKKEVSSPAGNRLLVAQFSGRQASHYVDRASMDASSAEIESAWNKPALSPTRL